MAPHPHKEEEKSDESIFYLVGLLSGLFTGVVIGGFIWVPILGAFGLLFAGFFYTVFVKGRNSA